MRNRNLPIIPKQLTNTPYQRLPTTFGGPIMNNVLYNLNRVNSNLHSSKFKNDIINSSNQQNN
jgi:hypothetical protein